MEGIFQIDSDGTLGERKTSTDRGVVLKDCEQALRVYASWFLSKPMFQIFYGSEHKSDFMRRATDQWKLDGVIIHLNRGCEGTVIGSMEIDSFMESLSLSKIEQAGD